MSSGNRTSNWWTFWGVLILLWAMFPLLKGQTQQQVANPQTYSISQQSTNKQAAMFFLAYLVNKQNLAKLALGDWLIPSNPEAGVVARKSRRAGSSRCSRVITSKPSRQIRRRSPTVASASQPDALYGG